MEVRGERWSSPDRKITSLSLSSEAARGGPGAADQQEIPVCCVWNIPRKVGLRRGEEKRSVHHLPGPGCPSEKYSAIFVVVEVK